MDDGFRHAVKINPGLRSQKGSSREHRDLAISTIFLTTAMTIIYSRSFRMSTDPTLNILLLVLMCFVLVSVSFVAHEMGHRWFARKYGAWAEYRMFPLGLLVSLFTAFMGILFAAPGAVVISGRIDTKQYGIISAAGPAVNLVLGAAFLAVFHMTTGSVHVIAYLFASLNIFLALFNLLPIPPLDGSKIMRWSTPALALMLICAGLLLVGLNL